MECTRTFRAAVALIASRPGPGRRTVSTIRPLLVTLTETTEKALLTPGEELAALLVGEVVECTVSSVTPPEPPGTPSIVDVPGKTLRRGAVTSDSSPPEAIPPAPSSAPRWSTVVFSDSLTFSEIAVRPLGSDYALANGRFALKRTAAGGGDAAGRFTLVLRKTKAGWKIIHDHSS